MGSKSSLMLQDEEIKQISEETGFSSQQIVKLFSRFTQLDRSNCGTLSKNDLLSIPELAINPLCDRLIEIFFSDITGTAGRQQQIDDDERINFRQFMRVLAAFSSSSSSSSSSSTTNSLSNNISTAATKNHQNQASKEQALNSPSNVTNPKRLHSTNGLKIFEPLVSSDGQTKLNRDHRKHQHHHLYNNNNNNQLTARKSVSIQQGFDRTTSGHDTLNDNLRDRLYFVFKIYDADNDGRISFGDLRIILKMMVGNYIDDVQLDKITTRAFVEVDQDNDGFIEFNEFCKVFAGKDMDLFRLSI